MDDHGGDSTSEAPEGEVVRKSLRTDIRRPSRFCEEFDTAELSRETITDTSSTRSRKRKATSPPPVERHVYKPAAFPSLPMDETPSQREERERLEARQRIAEEAEKDDGLAAIWSDFSADAPGAWLAWAFIIRARRAHRNGVTKFIHHFRTELEEILSHPTTIDEPSLERKCKTFTVVWLQIAKDVFGEEPQTLRAAVIAVELHLKKHFQKRKETYNSGNPSPDYSPRAIAISPTPITVPGFGIVSAEEAGLTIVPERIPTPPDLQPRPASLEDDLSMAYLVESQPFRRESITITLAEKKVPTPLANASPISKQAVADSNPPRPESRVWLNNAMMRENRYDRALQRAQDSLEERQIPRPKPTHRKMGPLANMQYRRRSKECADWEGNLKTMSWLDQPDDELEMNIYGRFEA